MMTILMLVLAIPVVLFIFGSLWVLVSLFTALELWQYLSVMIVLLLLVLIGQ